MYMYIITTLKAYGHNCRFRFCFYLLVHSSHSIDFSLEHSKGHRRERRSAMLLNYHMTAVMTAPHRPACFLHKEGRYDRATA